MALVTRATGNVIQASDIDQYYNLMTGAMTDQPVGLAYSPASSTTTPVLKLTGNANGPLLQLYNGATQKLQVDQNGNVTATGTLSQLGDKPSTGMAGINTSTATTELGGSGTVALKVNNYNDGSSDRYSVNGYATQVYLGTSGETGLFYRAAGNGTAGAIISWTTARNIAVLDSAGGGAAGAKIWVGTTDPGASAGEGDLWAVG